MLHATEKVHFSVRNEFVIDFQFEGYRVDSLSNENSTNKKHKNIFLE